MEENGNTKCKSEKEKKLESNFDFLGPSSAVGGGEQFLIYEAAYFSQNEELNLLRKKCQSLQMALDKCHDEQQDLQLQLLTERGQKEKAVKKVELMAEKTKVEYNGHLYSVKLDQERWKQQAESATREVQLLHDQLKVVQAQKSDAMQKLAKLTVKYEEMDGQRRLIDTYIERQKNSASDLNKRLRQLEVTKNDMSRIMDAHREQINLFNVRIIAEQRKKSAADATITELEKEIIQLKSSKVQDQARLKRSLAREENHLKLISELRQNSIKVSELEAENELGKKQVLEMQDEIRKEIAKNSKLQAEIKEKESAFAEQIENLQNIIQSLRNEVTEATNLCVQSDSKEETINTEIEELTKAYNQLYSKNRELNSKNHELTEENEVMHLSVDDHMLKLKTANSEIGQLKAQIAKLTADLQDDSKEKKYKSSRRRL